MTRLLAKVNKEITQKFLCLNCEQQDPCAEAKRQRTQFVMSGSNFLPTGKLRVLTDEFIELIGGREALLESYNANRPKYSE